MTKEKFRCKQDPNSGELRCRSFIENKDGTETELARLTARTDDSCTPVVVDFSENAEGEFEKLEKKVVARMVGKCKSKEKPKDF